MDNNFNKKTKYQISFSIILCVVTFLIGFSYTTTLNEMKKNLFQSNQNTITNISQILDNKIKQVEKIVFQISNSYHINYLLNLDSSRVYTSEDILEIKRATDYFKNIYANYDYIIDIQIFLKNSAKVCGVSGLQDYEKWENKSFQKDLNSNLNFKELNDAEKGFNLFTEINYYKNGTQTKVIPITQTLPIIGENSLEGIIYIFIDKNALFKDISLSINMSSFSVYNKNGDYLFSWGKYINLLDKNPLNIKELNLNSFMKKLKVGDTDFFSAQDIREDFIYSIYTEKMPFMDSLNNVRNLFFVLLGFSIFILFIVTYRITSILSKSIERLFVNNEFLNEELKKQEGEIISGQLYRVIFGNYNFQQNSYETNQFNKIFPIDSKYILILARIDFQKDLLAKNRLKYLANVKTKVKTVLNSYNDIYFLDTTYDSFVLIIKDYEFALKTYHPNLEIFINELYFKFESNDELEIYFFCSKLSNNLFDLNTSYTEAKFCMETKKRNDKKIYYVDQQIMLPIIYFPLELEQKLMLCVKTNDLDALEQIMQKLYIDNFVNQILSKRGYILLISKLKACLYSLCDELCVSTDVVYIEILKYVSGIEQNKNAKNDFDNIKKFILDISKSGNEHRKETSKQFFDNLFLYIDENCFSQQISLSSVANLFEISESKLSIFIKNYLGDTFQHYVENKRLERACKLLENGLKIDCIAKEVGYSNSHSFRRAFKRKYGINPSNY